MSNVQPSQTGYQGIADILRTLRAGWVQIVAGSTLFAVLGLVYAYLSPEIYRTDVVVAPATRDRMSEALGQFGSLAGLAGVNIRGGADPTPLAVLRSREFAVDFVSEPTVRQALARRFSASDGPMDPREMAMLFDSKVRSIAEDKRTGLVTVTISWTDPVLAASWANSLIDELNNKLRVRALQESQDNVTYLQKEIASTGVPSLQQSLGRVLEFEMQKLMLARGNQEFAFKIVDRALPPTKRYSPQRAVIIVLASLIGFCFSASWVLIRPSFRRSGSAESP